MVIPTSFGRKLGGDRPVASWILQETTTRRDCETGIGGMDDDTTLVSRRVPACRKEDRDTLPQTRPYALIRFITWKIQYDLDKCKNRMPTLICDMNIMIVLR